MSSYNVINEIEKSISALIDSKWGDEVSKPGIWFESPGNVSSKSGPNISIFLFQTVENTHLRNVDPEIGSDGITRQPALALDLIYLVTPFAGNPADEKKIIGRLIQIFYSFPIITVPHPDENPAGTKEEIRILFHSFSLDDLTKIWTAFHNLPYRFSVGFIVTPVFVDSIVETIVGRRVEKRNTIHAQISPRHAE